MKLSRVSMARSESRDHRGDRLQRRKDYAAGKKVFIAAALAHNQTGRPISTIRRSAPWGWNNWLCCKPTELSFARHRWSLRSERQPRQHFEMIDLGAYVQFDTIGKNSYYRTKSALRCSTRYVTVGC